MSHNVVYNTRGAEIVTEDGNERFNVIERNLAVRFEGTGAHEPAHSISMTYDMQSGDPIPRDPVYVFDYNQVAGDNYLLLLSRTPATGTARPCHGDEAKGDGRGAPDGVEPRGREVGSRIHRR